MNVDLDVRGRWVLVIGDEDAARRVLRRYRTRGAEVTHAAPGGALPAVPAGGLVVTVGLGQREMTAIAATCAARGAWHTDEAPAESMGRVTLVGGGPGARGLLTLGAVDALREADVVLYDRLSANDELTDLAPGAQLIDVGKRPGHHPISQAGIETLIVTYARSGDHVVRLKGGDPFVFGRGGEEVLACRVAGIPVEVVSGISSAISVPAAVGIPVTHRGVSRMFTVVSGHAPLSDDELRHLAGLGGTIVVLMGIGTLPQTVVGLLRTGASPDLPVAVIERGFGSRQRTTVARLDTVVARAAEVGATSPAVIVFGEVVRLGDHLRGTELDRLADVALATVAP